MELELCGYRRKLLLDAIAASGEGAKMQVKTVAIWGALEVPGGYVLLGVLTLDPKRDLFFSVGAPAEWVRSASQMELARALIETISKEVINCQVKQVPTRH
jgi:hypothetical protein